MKILRNTIKTKENIWNEALEREQNYREHLARLSIELITVRQISETRYTELQTISQKLMVFLHRFYIYKIYFHYLLKYILKICNL
jgi:hypothetical protein